MGRGLASKKLRTQNRAVAAGRGTFGSSRAQASRNGSKTAKKQKKNPDVLPEIQAMIVSDDILYHVTYALITETNQLKIIDIAPLAPGGPLRTRTASGDQRRAKMVPVSDEIFHKVAKALIDRLTNTLNGRKL